MGLCEAKGDDGGLVASVVWDVIRGLFGWAHLSGESVKGSKPSRTPANESGGGRAC